MMRDPSAKYSETSPNTIVLKTPHLGKALHRLRAPPPADTARAHNRPFVTKLDPGDEELPLDASDR